MRRKSLHNDSLDFLLDAMCNVFGTILFVAILVAVTSGTAVLRKASSDPAAEERALREKITLREAELAAAEAELALWESLAAASNPEAASPAPDTLNAAVRHNQQLAREVNALGSSLPTLHSERIINAQKLSSAEEFSAWDSAAKARKIAELREAIVALQTKIAAAEAEPERFTPHVLQKADGLQPWRLLITKAVHEVGPNRAIRAGAPESDAVKIDHFQLQDAAYWRLVPVAESGVAVRSFDAAPFLAKAPPERYFMELFCAPDAIAETAQIVRKLRHAGYRVNWRVMPPEGALVAERKGGRYEAAQ